MLSKNFEINNIGSNVQHSFTKEKHSLKTTIAIFSMALLTLIEVLS